MQGASADFTMTFTTPGILLDNSYLQVELPYDQITIQTNQAAYTATDGGSTTLTYSTVTSSSPSTYNVIQFTEWMCNGNCNPGTTFTLKLSNSQNPYIQSTIYNDFIINFLWTDGSPIFTTSSPLLATPSLQYGTITPMYIT